jgi:enterochelin esterase family protein
MPPVSAPDGPSLTAVLRRLRALETDSASADGAALAADLRSRLPAEELRTGSEPLIDELTAIWALESPDADAVRVAADDGRFALALRRLDEAGLFAGGALLPTGAAFRWSYEVTRGGRRTLLPECTPDQQAEQAQSQRGIGNRLEVYATHPDSRPRPDVPRGTLHAHPEWRSQIFAGTTRDWWLYVPAQRPGDEPASAMVFQDGGGSKDWVPTIFDNLIADGDVPPTVGIFISPGVFADGRRNRSVEYDTLSDRYASFLLEEILPEVERTVRLRPDPESRALCGASSGGICAFTAAWERPEAFRKVVSWIGSFTNIAHGESGVAGGHNYPAMIRRVPRKPIRVFLQDGENDLNREAGDWWLANLALGSALAFRGYDFTTRWGAGFHSGRHGRAIFPETLRWLWRDWRDWRG